MKMKVELIDHPNLGYQTVRINDIDAIPFKGAQGPKKFINIGKLRYWPIKDGWIIEITAIGNGNKSYYLVEEHRNHGDISYTMIDIYPPDEGPIRFLWRR